MYKVVLIGDAAIITEGLQKVLDWPAHGCRVAALAQDAASGAGSIRDRRPDILFTDIKMPGDDGLTMLADLKGEFPRMQSAALIGYRDFEYAQRAIRLGVSRFLLKPSRMKQRHLSKLLNKHLGQLFYDLRNAVRIRPAKRLMTDPALRISEVAGLVGYTDTPISPAYSKNWRAFPQRGTPQARPACGVLGRLTAIQPGPCLRKGAIAAPAQLLPPGRPGSPRNAPAVRRIKCPGPFPAEVPDLPPGLTCGRNPQCVKGGPAMVSVSLCMIVKNEEDVLERCLESAAGLVDEIILVDTGSTDRTREISARFTDKIYDFPWQDDFSAARNESFSHASMDYCMWLDADDVLLEPDQACFLALKETLDPAVSVVMAPYHTGFDESGRVTFSYYRERLIKNRAGMCWAGAVHEAVTPAGPILYGDFAVTHRKTRPSDPDRNLRIYQAQLAAGKELEPRQQFYYGRELYYHQRWEEALCVFRQFLADGQGWVENNIDACCHCAYCYEALGRSDEALAALLRTFAYDRPRAEVCCELGGWFFRRERYGQAAYWYALALTCTRDDRRGGFVSPDCYGYLPCIQLCVCYSRLGDQKRAESFNELAASYKPDCPAVLQNRAWFQSLTEQTA